MLSSVIETDYGQQPLAMLPKMLVLDWLSRLPVCTGDEHIECVVSSKHTVSLIQQVLDIE